MQQLSGQRHRQSWVNWVEWDRLPPTNWSHGTMPCPEQDWFPITLKFSLSSYIFERHIQKWCNWGLG